MLYHPFEHALRGSALEERDVSLQGADELMISGPGGGR